MAQSTCVKCGNHTFELALVEPQRAMFKLHFVQCTSCGGVVGVTEYYNIGATLEKIAAKIGVSV